MFKKVSIVSLVFISTLVAGCSTKSVQTSSVESDPVINESENIQSNEPVTIDTNETEDFDRGDSDSQAYTTEYDIDMTDFEYSLTDLQAKPGDTITINLTNSEGTHDLVITDLDVHSEHLDEGTSDVMTIKIPEVVAPGTVYEYFCSVGDHRKEGMVGTITII